MNMNTLPLKIQRARYKLLRERPYLARVALRLIPVESEKVPTAAVDQYYRLYWHPARVDEWSEEWVGVLYHECLHLLYQHHARGDQSAPPQARNIAADLAINCQIRREGFCLPAGCVYPEQYGLPDGLSFEQYLDALRAEMPQPQPESQPDPGPGAGDCGSAADGYRREYELPAPQDSSEGVDDAEGNIIRRQIAREIAEAARVAGRGDVPGHLREWAEAALRPPKQDWRRLLAAYIRRAVSVRRGCGDYSLRCPSRRAMARGIIAPSQAQPDTEIAAIIDTSGSMGEGMIRLAVAHVLSIARQLGLREIVVVECDAAAHICRIPASARHVEIIGRGGTDMRIGIAAAEALRPRPAAIVLLSDCDTPWPEHRPQTPLIIGRIRSHSPAPSWARVVDLQEEEE